MSNDAVEGLTRLVWEGPDHPITPAALHAIANLAADNKQAQDALREAGKQPPSPCSPLPLPPRAALAMWSVCMRIRWHVTALSRTRLTSPHSSMHTLLDLKGVSVPCDSYSPEVSKCYQQDLLKASSWRLAVLLQQLLLRPHAEATNASCLHLCTVKLWAGCRQNCLAWKLTFYVCHHRGNRAVSEAD